jgi:hypothetical protein
MYFHRHFARLKYFTYCLVSVFVLNYKQHISLPATIRKMCCSLAQLYVKTVYLNLFRWRGGAMFMKYSKGGASYKSLGTSGLSYDLIN